MCTKPKYSSTNIGTGFLELQIFSTQAFFLLFDRFVGYISAADCTYCYIEKYLNRIVSNIVIIAVA